MAASVWLWGEPVKKKLCGASVNQGAWVDSFAVWEGHDVYHVIGFGGYDGLARVKFTDKQQAFKQYLDWLYASLDEKRLRNG